jgi:hypothetical protein
MSMLIVGRILPFFGVFDMVGLELGVVGISEQTGLRRDCSFSLIVILTWIIFIVLPCFCTCLEICVLRCTLKL